MEALVQRLSWSRARKMNKKGVFFIIDVVLAIIIFAIGAVVVFSTYVDTPTYVQGYSISSTLMTFMATTPVDGLNDAYLRTLVNTGVVDDPEASILVVLGELYHEGKLPVIRNIIKSTTSDNDIVIEPYNFAFYIDETEVYNSSESASWSPPDDTDTIVPEKRLVLGLDDDNELWGPYIIEVRIW
jgi:hypothetical protein